MDGAYPTRMSPPKAEGGHHDGCPPLACTSLRFAQSSYAKPRRDLKLAILNVTFKLTHHPRSPFSANQSLSKPTCLKTAA